MPLNRKVSNNIFDSFYPVIITTLNVFIPAGITSVPKGTVVYYNTTNSRYELWNNNNLDSNELTLSVVEFNEDNLTPNALNRLKVIIVGRVDSNQLKYFDGTNFQPITNLNLHHPNIKIW